MPLPNPYDYEDWKEFAVALLTVLGSASEADSLTGAIDGSQVVGSIPATSLPATNPDYPPVFWSFPDQQLFLSPDFTVPPPIITPFQIDTQSLALAAVETGILADGAVVTAKITDLTVLNSKIANATILSAKIGDAQIISAKIADLAVITAKINDLAVGTAKIGDLAVTTAKMGLAQIGTAQIGTAVITQALMASASIGSAQIIDASILTADIGLAQITTALIGSAQIVTANIGAAQISTALIQTAAIVNALIADGTILNAKIADATIASAKIATLIVDKLAAGTLDAEIDMGTGLIRFTIGGFTLTIGKGFGTSSQFIMWFGPTVAEASMDEASATFYLKTNGDAYFGGTLFAGLIRNTLHSTDISSTNIVTVGDFASNGGVITIISSYDFHHNVRKANGTASFSGSGGATVVIEGSTNSGGAWSTLATYNPTETQRQVLPGDPGLDDVMNWRMSGSTTTTWTPGAQTDLQVRSRITARSEPTYNGGAPSGGGGTGITQDLGIQTTE